MSSMNEFIKERIARAKAQIVLYEDAIEALTVGGVQSYTLNTGQGSQTVTNMQLGAMQRNIDALMNRIITLESRLTGSGVTTGVPGF